MIGVYEEVSEGLRPSEQSMEPSFDPIVNGATKNKVDLSLHLVSMA